MLSQGKKTHKAKQIFHEGLLLTSEEAKHKQDFSLLCLQLIGNHDSSVALGNTTGERKFQHFKGRDTTATWMHEICDMSLQLQHRQLMSRYYHPFPTFPYSKWAEV